MQYPNQSDTSTHFVRCLKCMKILKCSRYDTSTLLEHIRTEHPEIEIIESESNNNSKNKQTESKSNMVNETETTSDIKGGAEKDDANVIYTRRYHVTTPDVPQSPQRRKLYRTSIEKWRPASGCIYCPKCCERRRPLIRTRAEIISNNQCGAACILGCWPFCFLPCLFSGDNKEYLHCSNCKNFLGLYDREYNCVKPNRQFVDNSEAEQSEMSSKPESQLTEDPDCEKKEN